MQIRLLTPADAAPYRAFRLRALREHPDAFTSSFEEEDVRPVEDAAKRLAAADHRFWGAFDGGTLVGMVGLERRTRAKERHKAVVVGMYVAPEAAGRGIGAGLLDALIAQARRDGLGLLVLTVTDGNDGPTRLYERAGFRSIGVEPGAIRVDGRPYGKRHMVMELA
jgi:GNAT superfamily N-acetyltransferase